MSIPVMQMAFSGGEISPELFGQVQLEKYRVGCSTMRNMFVCYRGGAYSRAGTRMVGQCAQNSSLSPPVVIPFQFNVNQGYAVEAGAGYFRFVFQGGYVTETPLVIASISKAFACVIEIIGHGFATNDWVQLAGLSNVPQISGQTFVIVVLTPDLFYIQSPLTGVPINSTNFATYAGGGTAARIYTLPTPYEPGDLAALKWTQSADVMTITHPSYPPADLARIGNAHWTLTVTTFGTAISAPPSASASASTTTGSDATTYQYVVTAVDRLTGEESVASPIAEIDNSVDIAVVAGTNTVTWAPVAGASSYNIYRAPPAFNSGVPPGSLFGYAGTAFGTSFADTNITPDATHAPPTHQNPFAVSAIESVTMTDGGASYTNAVTAVAVDPTGDGSGALFQAIQVGGVVSAIIVINGGQNYSSSTSIFINDSGGGTGAAATLVIGPATGTYPSCVAYFQQRRFYANTNNAPDTYFATQPGAFNNMDASTPTQDDDAIIGSPWSQQVDGIQALVPMPGGLVILTGRGAWQLSGGATQTAVTPSNQFATPQAYNGCSPLVRPLTINYDILYVQEKGSIVRDLSYNFFVSIYTGTDMTVLSNHLFEGFTILRWDWSEEPYKLIWAVRNDGILLCLTYLKEQNVYSWSRHDTNGLFQSVCCISEPPVNAPYFIVKRLIRAAAPPIWTYYMERMDDRIWENEEDPWCLDCALAYSMPAPDAALTASSATGGANITEYNLIFGGSGYTAPVGIISDATGAGATVVLSATDGVITGATAGAIGGGYANPVLTISDATGTGAVINPIVTNLVMFVASGPVLSMAEPGDVIRMGGGKAIVTESVTGEDITDDFGNFITNDIGAPITGDASVGDQTLVANLVAPITVVVPNDPFNTPVPAASGEWTITTPTDIVYGLDYLEGMTVGILADGGVVEPQVVTGGTVSLMTPASQITIGLPFTAQLQTLYLEAPVNPTIQTRRKDIYNVVARVQNSRGWTLGADQPDASTQPNGATVPWKNMVQVPQRGPATPPGTPISLLNGDFFTNITAQWGSNGQVAVQQTDPLPLNLIALVPWVEVGDSPSADQ